MAKKNENQTSPRKGKMTKRIKKAQRKAKWMGFFYLIGTIAMLGFAFLNLVGIKNTENNSVWAVTALNFYEPFLKFEAKLNYQTLRIIPVAVIYALLLLALVINVFRSLSKLNWLFKKKASQKYGYNRNAFAMEDMGRIYSQSFAAVLLVCFAFYLSGGTFTMFAYVAAGAGLFLHFWLGLVSGNVSLFSVEEGVGVVEEKRKYGRFSPIVRNLIQWAAVVGMAYFFTKISILHSTVLGFENGGLKTFLGDMNQIILLALEVLAMLCWVVLVVHAASNSEFDPDGRKAAGRKRFVWFSLFVFLLSAGLVAVRYFLLKEAFKDNMNTIYLAAVAFGAFFFELILCRLPRLKKAYRQPKAKKEKGKEAAKEDKAQPTEPMVERAPVDSVSAPVAPQRVPIQCFTQPCVITQGGEQYMVMPMSLDDLNTPVVEEDEPVIEYYFVNGQEEM